MPVPEQEVDHRSTRRSSPTPVEHPFYGPSERLVGDPASRFAGLATMAGYLLFWAAAVAIALHRVERRLPQQPPGAVPEDPALQIARIRYAYGAIDRDAYLAVLRDLRGGTP